MLTSEWKTQNMSSTHLPGISRLKYVWDTLVTLSDILHVTHKRVSVNVGSQLWFNCPGLPETTRPVVSTFPSKRTRDHGQHRPRSVGPRVVRTLHHSVRFWVYIRPPQERRKFLFSLLVHSSFIHCTITSVSIDLPTIPQEQSGSKSIQTKAFRVKIFLV